MKKIKLKVPKSCTVSSVLKDLGNIDKLHEKGKINKKQHDIRSKNALKRCW